MVQTSDFTFKMVNVSKDNPDLIRAQEVTQTEMLDWEINNLRGLFMPLTGQALRNLIISKVISTSVFMMYLADNTRNPKIYLTTVRTDEVINSDVSRIVSA